MVFNIEVHAFQVESNRTVAVILSTINSLGGNRSGVDWGDGVVLLH